MAIIVDIEISGPDFIQEYTDVVVTPGLEEQIGEMARNTGVIVVMTVKNMGAHTR